MLVVIKYLSCDYCPGSVFVIFHRSLEMQITRKLESIQGERMPCEIFLKGSVLIELLTLSLMVLMYHSALGTSHIYKYVEVTQYF